MLKIALGMLLGACGMAMAQSVSTTGSLVFLPPAITITNTNPIRATALGKFMDREVPILVNEGGEVICAR